MITLPLRTWRWRAGVSARPHAAAATCGHERGRAGVCVRGCVGGSARAYLRSDAGIILDSSAASIVCCHVLVDWGMTNPKLKCHSARARSGVGDGGVGVQGAG